MSLESFHAFGLSLGHLDTLSAASFSIGILLKDWFEDVESPSGLFEREERAGGFEKAHNSDTIGIKFDAVVFVVRRIIPVHWWHQLVSEEERDGVTDKGHPAGKEHEICKVGEAFAPRFDGSLVHNDLGHLGACYCRSGSSLSNHCVSGSAN